MAFWSFISRDFANSADVLPIRAAAGFGPSAEGRATRLEKNRIYSQDRADRCTRPLIRDFGTTAGRRPERRRIKDVFAAGPFRIPTVSKSTNNCATRSAVVPSNLLDQSDDVTPESRPFDPYERPGQGQSVQRR